MRLTTRETNGRRALNPVIPADGMLPYPLCQSCSALIFKDPSRSAAIAFAAAIAADRVSILVAEPCNRVG